MMNCPKNPDTQDQAAAADQAPVMVPINLLTDCRYGKAHSRNAQKCRQKNCAKL